MSTRIIATRKEYAPGADHRHIAAALTEDRRSFTRSELVQRIDNGWESFDTVYAGEIANVYARSCGKCGIRYATTTPDGTKYNNLLNLPDF